MSFHSGNFSSNISALPALKKTHSEKNKLILKQLLKEQANKTCADCKVAAHPRWASWNLGCFICIRCSGIHRSMGTHISKVKSVDLDAWTDEQIKQIVKWGNERCNIYWESKLPSGYVPDQSKLDNFIRTKYELKKWVSSSHIPDPFSLKGKPQAGNGVEVKEPDQQVAPRKDKPAESSTTKANGGNNVSLLDDDFGAFTSSTSTVSNSKSNINEPKESPSNHLSQLMDFNQSSSKTNVNVQHQSPQGTGGSANSNNRPDLKKSILSLYSSPSGSASSIVPPLQRQNPQYSKTADSSFDSLSKSLHGLNFNNDSRKSSPMSTGVSLNTVNQVNNIPSSTNSISSDINKPKVPVTEFNNEWIDVKPSAADSWNNSNSNSNLSNTGSGAGSSTVRAGSLGTHGLDDDLFKNVWS
ncbi:Piso0_003014 [Millerozyma farinosa CBS 7064]|uniref:Piso0_003014 protein n=1 Tax=Pichia sorbitophila (strain ATCC MYA-4447 / BCRC 22081 / CBS 7064 / NBRC 10061 / NRRL Y-12695) TaxID=559304 RepID=G8YK42_PICSO|nr:Piso0_003014 [Millerozyma farinosa CBS 7064]CCE80687.1 Piso0_003014 [Millerozyma farinosa CBS 7064]